MLALLFRGSEEAAMNDGLWMFFLRHNLETLVRMKQEHVVFGCDGFVAGSESFSCACGARVV